MKLRGWVTRDRIGFSVFELKPKYDINLKRWIPAWWDEESLISNLFAGKSHKTVRETFGLTTDFPRGQDGIMRVILNITGEPYAKNEQKET